MPLFQEVDLKSFNGGQITGIEPGSVAHDLGLEAGDELLAINGQAVADIIDVQFYGAEEEVTMTIRRDGELHEGTALREYQQTLGLEFTHPTFDTDIRRCNNLCEFCFVLQMAPKFRRTLYIKDDDYRYSFLFGHYVTLTNLSDHDWWRIETMGLSPLYVSVHVTDLEQRRAYLRNPQAADICEQIAWLGERGIEVHAQLVVSPGVNDGPLLEQSIADLAVLWPTVQSVSVVPVGLTRHHKYRMRVHTKAESQATLAYLESLQSGFMDRFGVRFVYPTDEWYLVTGRTVPAQDAYDGQALHENGLGMVRHFLDEWQSVKQEIAAAKIPLPLAKSATLVTGTLFGPTLKKVATEFMGLTGSQLQVLPAINHRLGDTITVAGLLMGKDILQQLHEISAEDLLILPRVMFDHPQRVALDDIAPQDIANQLKRPVTLADTMGDVWDALTGQAGIIYHPGKAPANEIQLRVLHKQDQDENDHFS